MLGGLMLEPSTSVQYVKGIGPRLADVLGAKGIHTVDDLLHYLPFRYEDRVNPRGISELRAGEMAIPDQDQVPIWKASGYPRER